jgi:hypothetical protein
MPQEKKTYTQKELDQEWEDVVPEQTPGGESEWETVKEAAPPRPPGGAMPEPSRVPGWATPFTGAAKLALQKSLGMGELLTTPLPGGGNPLANFLRTAGYGPPQEIARAGRPGQYPAPYTGLEREFWPQLEREEGGEKLGSAALETALAFAPGSRITAATRAAGKLGARLTGAPYAYPGAAGPMGSAIRPGPGQEAFEIFTRGGLEAASAGTQARLSQEDPTTAAAWAGGFPIAGRALAEVTKLPGIKQLPRMFTRTAEEEMGRILHPRTQEETRQAMQIAPKMLREARIPDIFKTRRGWAERALGNMKQALSDRDDEIALLASKSPTGKFELDVDSIRARVDARIKRELLTRGTQLSKGPHADKAMGEIEFRLKRLEEAAQQNMFLNITQGKPVNPAVKTIDYGDLDDFKTEWQHLLDEMGHYGREAGERIEDNPLRRALSILDKAVREEVADAAPNVSKFNKLASDEMLVMNPIDRKEVRDWARVRSGSRPIVAAGGGAEMLPRMTTFIKYRAVMALFDGMRNSAAASVAGAKGMKAVADMISRGEFDTASATIGRYFAMAGVPLPGMEEKVPTPGGLEAMEPEWTFDPKEKKTVLGIMGRTREPEEATHNYDPNSGGFIPLK